MVDKKPGSKFTVTDSRGGAPLVEGKAIELIIEAGKKAAGEADDIALEVENFPDAPIYSEINIEIFGNRILIQDFPVSTKIGRFFLPDRREVAINKGRICGVGPDCKSTIKVGDIISKVHDLGQTLLDDKGRAYIFLPENAVIARYKDLETNG